MRKRTLWIALGVLAGLWLVPALFVAVYDPSVPRSADRGGAPGPIESALGAREHQFFLFAHGYTKHWTVETWEGPDEEGADKTIASYHVERGPLDRKAGTFQFTLWCGMNHAQDLEGVRLLMTSVGDWSGGDEAIWAQVAEAAVDEPGAEHVALTCEAVVPASTTAYRLVEVRDGAPCCRFSKSMLTAPTVLGRVYDKIAPHPMFNWVPDLR